MPDSGQSVYFVSDEGDTVRLAIRGRASYVNCAPVQQFLDRLVAAGMTSLEIDFSGCTGMDSTFMGLIAGTAMEFRNRRPTPGEITLIRLSPRNLELVRNLGLHRLLKIAPAEPPPATPQDPSGEKLDGDRAAGQIASQETILRAHEDLMRADPTNVPKFRDVVEFLKRDAPPKP